jgi:hypothetical protein
VSGLENFGGKFSLMFHYRFLSFLVKVQATTDFVIYSEDHYYMCAYNATKTNGERVIMLGDPGQFYKSSLIYQIELPTVGFSKIPKELFEIFVNLREVIARNAGLRRIGNLRDCGSLIHLDVSSNQLKDLPLHGPTAQK